MNSAEYTVPEQWTCGSPESTPIDPGPTALRSAFVRRDRRVSPEV
ncbi:hypothetical protein B005_3048 [Nocardiopsis alba ATCC BAA-2165]|uniref:Uncharacterized protein n=1 Tax=Nocardiopsis alba (strain ATCC BAA-2165 / BE74) TaxID=1205910 RepID=J7L758_NOCAA|nr:hypothetical protein B005_3048 [Nocardiopsis alba ATCC BAA-2165]